MPGGGPARSEFGGAAPQSRQRAAGLDRLVDARAAYLEALRLNPNLAVANAHLGLVFQREGQLADALVWLKKAVELEPKNAACHEWLAELYDEMDEPDESIPCWEQVLALRPDRPGPHVSLGSALQARRPAGRGPRALPGRDSRSSPTSARPT